MLVSSLAREADLLPIVCKFVGRLQQRMLDLADLEARSDYPAIANFAHWLRGSAGSMGYDAFTEPAIELEAAAKAGRRERLTQLLGEVRGLVRRVVPPGQPQA